jgi:hypothetical protein
MCFVSLFSHEIHKKKIVLILKPFLANTAFTTDAFASSHAGVTIASDNIVPLLS